MPRTPSPPSSGSTAIQRVRLLKPDPVRSWASLRAMNEDNFKFTCIAAALSLALDLLSCSKSKRALGGYAEELADHYNGPIPELRGMSQSRAAQMVNSFLETIRANPPQILLTSKNHMCNKNGRTNKRDCSGPFDAKKAAIIELNDILANLLTDAARALRDNSRSNHSHYETLLCRTGITIAHELVHTFTLYLTRRQGSHTPPHISAGGQGTAEIGEAGRRWEYLVFGGMVEMRMDAAIPNIGICNDHGRYVWRMKTSLVQLILRRDFRSINVEPPTEFEGRLARDSVDKMDRIRWMTRFADPYPRPRNGDPRTLGSAEVDSLLGRTVQALPKFDINNSHLRAFALNPGTRVGIRAC